MLRVFVASRRSASAGSYSLRSAIGAPSARRRPAKPDASDMLRGFAVEPTAVQLVWRRLPSGHHEVVAGTRAVTVEADGGPGAVVIDGLATGTTVDITLDDRAVGRVTTLSPPPG